jgi:hypothetical protein
MKGDMAQEHGQVNQFQSPPTYPAKRITMGVVDLQSLSTAGLFRSVTVAVILWFLIPRLWQVRGNPCNLMENGF